MLREFYNKLQALCPIEKAENIPPEDHEPYKEARELYRDRTIRLIFWWNVQGNFSAFHRDKLNRLAYELKQAGIKAPLPALNGETGRIEMMTKLYDVAHALQAKYEEIAKEIRDLPLPGEEATEEEEKAYQERYEKAEQELNKLQDLSTALGVYEPLISLDARIPLNWVEPNSVLPPANDEVY